MRQNVLNESSHGEAGPVGGETHGVGSYGLQRMSTGSRSAPMTVRPLSSIEGEEDGEPRLFAAGRRARMSWETSASPPK